MDEFYMSIALDEAKKAYNKGEVPIGAVLVRRNEIIAKAHNLREATKDATAHAEILAIKKSCDILGGWRLTDSTLYVTIEPCPMCAGAILQSRIDRLVLGAMDEKAGACGSIVNLLDNPRFNHRVEITTGVMSEACAIIIRRFFRELRKQKSKSTTHD